MQALSKHKGQADENPNRGGAWCGFGGRNVGRGDVVVAGKFGESKASGFEEAEAGGYT